MSRILIVVIVMFGLFCHASFAGEMKEELKPYTGSAEFEKLKRLIGTWEGTHKMGEEEDPAAVEYYLTSNGSALVEKLFPGTPLEMITVYHDQKDELTMMHYCSVGNQPQMDLVASENNKMEFRLSATNTIDVDTEGHMHGLLITFLDDDTIMHNWTFYQEGKEAGTNEIKLTRVK